MPTKDKFSFDTSHDASSFGYSDYKEIKFKSVTGITIKLFRTLKDRELKLGKYLTLITGKNGTMKSCLLGLIAHPFSSPNDAKDLYNRPLKTPHKEIFRLSREKDAELYVYHINAETTDGHHISEPVRLYPRDDGSFFRVTVGATNTPGKGNFLLNTSYINLKRLFPIVETESKSSHIELSDLERRKISHAYERIMQRYTYQKIDGVTDKLRKNTIAPAESYYDFNSISSGEDNLGHILGKLISFERNKSDTDNLQGILCIDEIEASLHPSSQIGMIDYLLSWSKANHVQIVFTTHSLYLIDHCLRLQLARKTGCNDIVINNISTQQVGNDNNFNIMINPSFNILYKELTFQDPNTPSPYKVNIICEDKMATTVLKKIISKRSILANLEFISDLSDGTGNSWKTLKSIVKNGKRLLEDSIVVLDPDVPKSGVQDLDSDYFLIIPDLDNSLYPIERRVIAYLFNLDGSHSLFEHNERTAILASLTEHNIYQDTIFNENNHNISLFKRWCDDNKVFFNKALTSYIKENSAIFLPFKEKLVDLINQKRQKKALPPLSL